MASKVVTNVVNTARPVGKKDIYFPNIIFTLINAKNLQPNQAAFKVPVNLNKLDIRSYLTNIYGVKIKEVRTMVYEPQLTIRPGFLNNPYRTPGYKKAIITLTDGTFEYPPPPDNWEDDFQVDSKKLAILTQKRKARGWRIRLSDQEKKLRDELLKRAYDKQQEIARAEAKPPKKNKIEEDTSILD